MNSYLNPTVLEVTHFMTGSSTVACGAPMRSWPDPPGGWDLGNVTVDPGKVTCHACRGSAS